MLYEGAYRQVLCVCSALLLPKLPMRSTGVGVIGHYPIAYDWTS
jgi:hypothetical protein